MKVPCAVCDEMILPTTAQATGGICMLCKRGNRVPSAAKLQAQKEFQEEQFKPIESICYRTWVQRVVKFAEALQQQPGEVEIELQVGDCLSEAAFDKVDALWDNPLPRAIERFWKEGCNGLLFRFSWTPPAALVANHPAIFGKKTCFAGRLDFNSAEFAHAAGGWSSVDEEFWQRSIVLLDLGNGDQVLADPGSGSDQENPPVVYFCHESDDEPISELAPSFSRYLQRVEEEAYQSVTSKWMLYDPKRTAYLKALGAFLRQQGLRK
jgi:hypothetical protein